MGKRVPSCAGWVTIHPTLLFRYDVFSLYSLHLTLQLTMSHLTVSFDFSQNRKCAAMR